MTDSEKLSLARKMYRSGSNFAEIGRAIGVDWRVAQALVAPEHAAEQRARRAAAQAQHEARQRPVFKSSIPSVPGLHGVSIPRLKFLEG